MRYGPRALLAGGLGFAVSFLVACGGGAGLLSGEQSSTLNSKLDAVSHAVARGHCGSAAHAVAGLGSAVAGLPVTINATLRANLIQGVSTVGALSAHDCLSATTATPSHSTTTPSSTATTTPSTTTTTPSTTTTTTTTTPTTTSTTSSSTTTPATSTTPPGSTTSGSGGAPLGGSSGGGSSGGAGTGPGNGGGGQ